MSVQVDYTAKPYAQWIENTVQQMFGIEPVAIAMQMRDAKGETYTCYWDCSQDDRAIMVDAMLQDGFLTYIRQAKDEIRAILNGEDESDELRDADSETDSAG